MRKIILVILAVSFLFFIIGSITQSGVVLATDNGNCSSTQAPSCPSCATPQCLSNTWSCQLNSGWCIFGGSQCVASGTTNPNNPCQVCDPTQHFFSWSNKGDGTSCGNCKICSSGSCNSTTTPSCPSCASPVCNSNTWLCVANSGYCTLGGYGCAASGTVNPNNPCQVCDPTRSLVAWSNVNNGPNCGNCTVCPNCSSFVLSGSTSNLLLNANEISSDWTGNGIITRAPPLTGFVEGSMRDYDTPNNELVKLDISLFDSEANALGYLNMIPNSFPFSNTAGICGISNAISFENASQTSGGYTVKGYVIKQGKYTVGIYGYSSWDSINKLLIAFSNKYAATKNLVPYGYCYSDSDCFLSCGFCKSKLNTTPYCGGVINPGYTQTCKCVNNFCTSEYIPIQNQTCANHNDCSQACDNLGINFKWMGSGSSYRSWTGNCSLGVFGCMTGQCCLGQCNASGTCYCQHTNVVDIYGNVCPSGQSCGSDCYCHSSNPVHTIPVTEEYKTVNLGDTFTVSASQVEMLSGSTGTATATQGVTYGGYTVYATLGGTNFVRVSVKDQSGNTVEEDLISNIPNSVDTTKTTPILTIKATSVAALADGTVVGAYIVVGTNQYNWQLKSYDSNYLEQGPIGSCFGTQVNSACTYSYSFKAINNGKTTIELDKINNTDKSVAEIHYIYVTILPKEIEVTTAYLNQPFELNVTGSAEIVDYKNMIVTLDSLETIAIPCAVNAPNCGNSGWFATVSFKMPGSLVTNSINLNIGDSKDTPYGVKIRFERVDLPRSAVFTVYQGTSEFKLSVRTDKYTYSPGDDVRIYAALSGNPSINFKGAYVVTNVTDPNGNQYQVPMMGIGTIAQPCTQSVTTGTTTCAIINEYDFTGIYSIPSDSPYGTYQVTSTAFTSSMQASASANFEVQNNIFDYVNVSISPKEQYTTIGSSVSYDITVTDHHPIQSCPVNQNGCVQQLYTYYLTVSGLPYSTKYQNVVSVPAGGSMVISLLVFPSSTGTAQGVTTATATVTNNPTSSSERTVSTVTGQASATSTTPVAPPLREAMFKFTVQATLQNDKTVSNSDNAVLYVRFVETPQPPPFPVTEAVDIQLKNGWNLISAPGYGTFSAGTCTPDSNLVAFVYLADQQRYVSFQDAATILGTGFKDYLSTHSFWVYTNQNCQLEFDVEKYSTYSGMQLAQGWNLLGVTKDMVGETISNIKGSCVFEKIYSWDTNAQNWVAKTENDLIDKMGYGVIAKVTSACNLNTNVVQIPVLPGS